MSDDIVTRLRDFQTWQFRVPECGHHQNTGATAASIFVPEAKTKSGWVPVLCETGYSDGWRRYMFNPLFMLKEAADEIERLRTELVSMTDKFNRLKDAIPTTDEMTTPIVGYLVQTAHGSRWVPVRSIESISIYEGGSMIFWMRDGEELEAQSHRILPCRDWPDHTTYEIAIEWARQAEEASKQSRPGEA